MSYGALIDITGLRVVFGKNRFKFPSISLFANRLNKVIADFFHVYVDFTALFLKK